MSDIYTKEFEVCTYDVDINQHLRISRIFAFFQEVAWLHAEKLGFGFFAMEKEHNAFWAISRLCVKPYFYPKWGDTLTLKTWTVNASRLFAQRDFEVYLGDKLCASGSSDWIIADLKTRTLMEPQKVLATAPYVFGEGLEGISTKRIKRSKLSIDDKCIRKVRYNDLDMNNHLNSIRYLDWVLDCLPREWHINNKVNSLQINYMHEINAGENVEISNTLISEKPCVMQFTGTIESSKLASFIMDIGFESTEI